MSSVLSPPSAAAGTTTSTAAFLRPSLLPPKPSSQLSAYKARKPYHSPRFPRVSCKKPPDETSNDQITPSTRRDLLIGMGSLYGAASSLPDPAALADPIQPPDLSKCGLAVKGASLETVYCCPPFAGQNIIDFKFPSPHEPMRTRPAAHSVDPAYVQKYEKAIACMKALPDDDPRSFKQQADVHCAYCNGAYDQVGTSTDLQIHFSWIFFPFHRFYLHFFERILGSLIDDPTFALPFWNWDSPQGIQIPPIFADPDSPLFDPIRNPNHLPGGSYPLVDLGSGGDVKTTLEEQWLINRSVMHRTMVSGAKKRTLFFGQRLEAGQAADKENGQGSVEGHPHGNIHIWVGDRELPNREDMGNLYSAGRDPLFYCHHGNVDRLWDLWKTVGPRRTDFRDPDWLDAAFLFYDENKNLVRCRVRDSLDNKKLRTNYETVPIHWREVPKKTRKKKAASAKKRELTDLSKFPVVLNRAISVAVPRPRKNRGAKEKEDEEEVLVVEGIEIERSQVVMFDVALNDDDDGAPAGPQNTEFAGGFVNVPHRHKPGAREFKTSLRLGITDLLEDLGSDGDDTVVVTLVPKVGDPKIGGLKIDYLAD